tara:strand:- start:295 stop:1278 length:984 start_codon:yes stop_codon:yes gene_type:complete
MAFNDGREQIIEAVGPNGVRTWITVPGPASMARTQAMQILEKGYFVNFVLPATNEGIGQLRSQSPQFNQTFPSGNFSPEGISKTLGGAVQADTTPPPSVAPLPMDNNVVPAVLPGDFESAVLVNQPQEALAPDTLGMQRSQYMRGLGARGIGTSGIAGKQRRDAFDPTFNRFLYETMMNPEAGNFSAFNDAGTLDLTGADAPSFSEYTRTNPLFGSGANNQAKAQFAQALEASRGVNPAGTRFDTLAAGQQDILNPQSAAQAGILNSLANQTARARYGVGAEFLGNRNYTDEFFGQAKNTGTESFAEFLNNRIFGSGTNPLTAISGG